MYGRSHGRPQTAPGEPARGRIRPGGSSLWSSPASPISAASSRYGSSLTGHTASTSTTGPRGSRLSVPGPVSGQRPRTGPPGRRRAKTGPKLRRGPRGGARGSLGGSRSGAGGGAGGDPAPQVHEPYLQALFLKNQLLRSGHTLELEEPSTDPEAPGGTRDGLGNWIRYDKRVQAFEAARERDSGFTAPLQSRRSSGATSAGYGRSSRPASRPSTSTGRATRLRPQGIPPSGATGVSYLPEAMATQPPGARVPQHPGPPSAMASDLAWEAAAAASAPATTPEEAELVERFRADRMWHLKEFDSFVPAGRTSALQLRTWLTGELGGILPEGWNTGGAEDCAGVMGGELWQERLHDVFTGCVQELVRQLSVRCMEHGQLLAFIWSSYVEALRTGHEAASAAANAAVQQQPSTTDEGSLAGIGERVSTSDEAEGTAEGGAPRKDSGDSRSSRRSSKSSGARRRSRAKPTPPSPKVAPRKAKNKKGRTLIRGQSYLERRAKKDESNRRWRIATIAARFLGHYMFKLQGGQADDGPRPGREFMMSRNTVLKHIKDLLEQMGSFKRLRNAIFTEFTIDTEVADMFTSTKAAERKEELMLSMLYSAHHTSNDASLQRHVLQARARTLLREGITTGNKRDHVIKAMKLKAVREGPYEPPPPDEAATRIQAQQRGRAVRMKQRERQLAAVVIQKLARGRLVRAGHIDPKFDHDPLQLKRAGRPGFAKDMRSFDGHVARDGEKNSLNERRLGSLLEEVVWETKQFTRDVATAWWRRQREMKQAALDQIRKEVSVRLEATNQILEGVLSSTHSTLAADIDPSGVFGILARSLSSREKGPGEDDREDDLDDPEMSIFPLTSRVVRRGYRKRDVKALVETVRNYEDAWSCLQMVEDPVERPDAIARLAEASNVMSKALVRHSKLITEARAQLAALERLHEDTQTNHTGSILKPGVAVVKKKSRKKRKGDISGILLTVGKNYKPRVLTLSAMLQLIDELYANKQEYDEMDDRDGNTRRSLPEFLYDKFFRKYGLRRLAEQRVVDVVTTVTQYRTRHCRVSLFARFCGLGEKLPIEALNFYLLMLQFYRRARDRERGFKDLFLVTEHAAMDSITVVSQLLFQGQSKLLASVDIDEVAMAKRLSDMVGFLSKDESEIAIMAGRSGTARAGRRGSLRSSPSPTKTPNRSRRAATPMDRPRRSSVEAGDMRGGAGGATPGAHGNLLVVRYVDIDKLLDALVQEFMHLQGKVQSVLIQMFTDGDTNADGVLTFEEFRNVCYRASEDITDSKLWKMFDEALIVTESSGSAAHENDTVTAEAFVRVVQANGFLFAPLCAARARRHILAVKAVLAMNRTERRLSSHLGRRASVGGGRRASAGGRSVPSRRNSADGGAAATPAASSVGPDSKADEEGEAARPVSAFGDAGSGTGDAEAEARPTVDIKSSTFTFAPGGAASAEKEKPRSLRRQVSAEELIAPTPIPAMSKRMQKRFLQQSWSAAQWGLRAELEGNPARAMQAAVLFHEAQTKINDETTGSEECMAAYNAVLMFVMGDSTTLRRPSQVELARPKSRADMIADVRKRLMPRVARRLPALRLMEHDGATKTSAISKEDKKQRKRRRRSLALFEQSAQLVEALAAKRKASSGSRKVSEAPVALESPLHVDAEVEEVEVV